MQLKFEKKVIVRVGENMPEAQHHKFTSNAIWGLQIIGGTHVSEGCEMTPSGV